MAYGHTVPRAYHYRSPAARSRLAAFAALSLFVIASAAPCAAQTAEQSPIKGTVKATVTDGDFGYARIVIKLDAFNDVQARVSNSVLIVTFDKPVDLVVDRLPQQISDYVGAARRDPDGLGVRAALAKNVKVNAISAGQQIFIDLLPEPWSGPPPGLPQEVIEDLARRARLADKLERKEQEAVQQQVAADPVKVHVATQPTFTRYIFNVPQNTAVSANRDKEKLTLTFDSPIKFDLGDAQAALPKTVTTLDTETKDATSQVSFTFMPRIDVRTFRDDNGYDVDVVSDEARADQPSGILSAPKQGAAPSNPSPVAPAAAPSQKQGAADSTGPVVAAAEKPEIAAPATIPASNSAPEAKATANETPAPAPVAVAPVVAEKPAAETPPSKAAAQIAEAAEQPKPEAQPKPEVQGSPAATQQPPVQQAQQ